MAADGLPPDRVPQDLRRQALSQLEEAIRNYPGLPPPNQQNHTEVESRLFEQSRNADEYTSKLQKILFMITKRKSQSNLAAQNPQQQSSGPPSLSQSSSLQQQQQQLGPSASYAGSGSNMASMNHATAGMGMSRPMQPMQPGGGGGGGGYQGYQVGATQMHPSQHPHYPPHMHRGMSGMQPGMHPAQRPQMMGGGGAPGMMHGGGHQAYGHPHNPMAVPNYTQNFQSHYNPPMSSNTQMHSMAAMGQRQSPSINPSLIRQQTPMGGLGGGMMTPHGGQGMNMSGVGRGGMMGVGVGGMGGRVGGGYGGSVMQQPPLQSGYSPDINGSVQNVMAVPNPSYLPMSSASGTRQPVPPYDPLGPPASSGAPLLPTSSAAAPVSSSAPSSQPQSSLSHPHPPSSSASVTTNPTTTAAGSALLQPVPSPAPPTPLLPASPATSVGSPAHSTVTPEENEAYLRTHHELQKYVPLLNRMMNRMLKKDGEEAQKSEQYMKLKSLHSLLQDDKKRVPLPTLIKCKTALEKMFEQQQLREHLDSTSSQPPPSNPPSVTPAPCSLPPSSVTIIDPPLPPTTKPLPEPKSQSLLEFKMIASPTPTPSGVGNTCNIEAHPFPADRLPPSKRLCNRVEPAISHGLRREIAHLVGFKVQPLSQEKVGGGTMLECHIVDEDLPTVPSLKVCIPPGYPNISPECDLNSYLNSTPLLTEVGQRLSDTLARCCDSYTLSFLLSSWETSLLRALASQF